MNEPKRVTVSLPLPVWELSDYDDKLLEWDASRNSTTSYRFYQINLHNFKCYEVTADGRSWCISNAYTCKSQDEAEKVCWEHYLAELGATPC